MITRSTSTPIIRAASASCAVARIALPSRVKLHEEISTPISASEIAQISTSRSRSTAPPMWKLMAGSGFGKFLLSAPRPSSTTLNRM